jgi:hypothetical protein
MRGGAIYAPLGFHERVLSRLSREILLVRSRGTAPAHRTPGSRCQGKGGAPTRPSEASRARVPFRLTLLGTGEGLGTHERCRFNEHEPTSLALRL